MAKIKRDDKKLPVAPKLLRGDQLIAALAGNTNPDVVAALAAFTLLNSKLRTDNGLASAARNNSKDRTAIETSSDLEWNLGLEVLIVAVEDSTKGNPDEIRPTTFVPYEPGKGAPVGVLAAPTGAHATRGDFPGQIDVGSNPVNGASSYVGQYTTTPNDPASYRIGGISTSSNFTIGNLVSGTTYFIQLAAVGAAGQGPWSDVVLQMAP